MDRNKKLDKVIYEFFEKKPKINSRELGIPPNNISSLLLYIDGVNRVYQYTQELNKPAVFTMSRVIESLNIFPEINPTWISELPEYDELIDYIEDLIPFVKVGRHRDLTRGFIYLFIYWEVYKDTEELQKFKHLDHPYESLIKIVVNGDYIFKGREHLELSELHGMVKIQKLRLPSIEDDFLTYIDNSKYSEKNELYFYNVPNQEDVNELWETFNLIK